MEDNTFKKFLKKIPFKERKEIDYLLYDLTTLTTDRVLRDLVKRAQLHNPRLQLVYDYGMITFTKV